MQTLLMNRGVTVAIISSEIVQKGNNNADMAKYSVFVDIPRSRYDEASLIGWMYHRGHLSAIPEPLWTEDLLEAAAYWDAHALASIQPSDTQDFAKLVDLALSSNASCAKHIRAKDYTEDFLIKICCDHPKCMTDIDWYGGVYDLLTDRVITEIGSASITGMLNLINHRPVNDDLITNEVVQSAIRNQPLEIAALAEYDQYHHVIVDMVDDYWPKFTPMYLTHFMKNNLDATVRPTTITQALDGFSVAPDKSIKVFYDVCVKKHPIEEVIETALGMKDGVNRLFDIYSEKELRPFINKYRALRGRVLEDALGM
jgi:hypothetical protein